MKLVDILARELKVWPEGVRVITQQQSGYLFDEANYPLDILVSESEDCFSATVPSAQWQAAVDALKAEKVPSAKTQVALEEARMIRSEQVVEWNGEGLPPVGTVCEFSCTPIDWVECTIYGISTFQGQSLLTVVFGGAICATSADLIRPIRTPEQIAAEEREVAINAMIDTLGHPTAILMRESILGALYDAGYRKLEIVDN